MLVCDIRKMRVLLLLAVGMAVYSSLLAGRGDLGDLDEAIAVAGAADERGNAQAAWVLGSLYALKDETLGGLTAPLTFTKGKPTSLKCWFYYQVKDGKFTNPYGVSPACASS